MPKISTKPKKQRIEFNQLILNKDEYKIGDKVRVKEYNDDSCYARILKIWRNPSKPDAFATILWYFKPVDIFKQIPSFISVAELMESDLQQDISVQCIYGKIEVVSFEEYHSKDEVESDFYFFTRSKFNSSSKVIRPPLSQWKRSCVCDSIINPDHKYVTCDRCSRYYHVECVKYTDKSLQWYCENCS